ncbi:MAG: hypothetical protein AB9856_10840 [Cellulosilyticaceae bacterium]
MSNPKFMVFKLKDLRIPIIILLVVLALFIFLMVRPGKSATTFAPSDNYKDGTYIASIALTDADVDLLVTVKDKKITSVALDGLDKNEEALYQDLSTGIVYVNDYITATQSLEMPDTQNLPPVTTMLLDAARVALSDDKDVSITTTYQKPVLQDVSVTESSVTGDTAKKSEADSNVQTNTPSSEKPADTKDGSSIVGEEVVE